MKKPTLMRILAPVIAIFVFSACKKEASRTMEKENETVRATGAVPDDPALIAKIPLIVSSEFFNTPNALGGKGGGRPRFKDGDGDGITDANDACPTQKETLNGYQDTDGCPDTAPITSTDSDGDGILDSNDACTTQPETVNGYQDTDGCPDTVPDTDGDGIIDTQDTCPTEAETVNGYQDTDGCPDTAPVVLPPTSLPSYITLSMPPVTYQGGEGSCVAFSVGYAARSASWYYHTNATSYSYASNIFSPEFMYNLTKIADCGSGTSIIRTLESLKNTGISTWQTMPYSGYDGCSTLPNSTQLAEAANFKIASYSAVYKSDIIALKTLLANKHPLVIMVVLDESFPMAGPGFIWKAYSGSGGFNHALTICGYDDSKHAFKVMSSWGTGWGEYGYSWIDYDFLQQTGDVVAYLINE